MDLQEQAIQNIRKKIENPTFKSKVEMARLAIIEYHKLYCYHINLKFKEQERRIEKLELKSKQMYLDRFNEGYNQAIKDYNIFPKVKLNLQKSITSDKEKKS